MKYYVYPGSFCPPTYGHFNVAMRAASILGEITIVCSSNPDKSGSLYSQEEVVELWKAYNLPPNIKVTTLKEVMSDNRDHSKTVIIRGIRGPEDLEDEKKVVRLNKQLFGINDYLYLLCEDGYNNISSSRARKLAQDFLFSELSQCLAPAVITSLLEKIHGAKNIFMVVGRPGAGKTTLLQKLSKQDSSCVHIETDRINDITRPLLEQAFPDKNLIQMSIDDIASISEVIGQRWLVELGKILASKNIKGKNVFIEIAYGLRPGIDLYRLLGNKVIHVGCNNSSIYRQRLESKAKAKLIAFIETIPDEVLSRQIAEDNGLDINFVKTDKDLNSALISIRQIIKRS